VTHACATLQHCQRCWVDIEQNRHCAVIDLRPHRRIVIAAAFDLASRMVKDGYHGQTLDNPERILADSLTGKAAELGYAVFAGLDPESILTDAKGAIDFGHVEVKQVKTRPQGWSSFTVSDKSWQKVKRLRDITYCGVQLDETGWMARIVGTITAADIAHAMRDGLVTSHAPARGIGAGWEYHEVRAHLLTPVAAA
jgi:hypothetical protein